MVKCFMKIYGWTVFYRDFFCWFTLLCVTCVEQCRQYVGSRAKFLLSFVYLFTIGKICVVIFVLFIYSIRTICLIVVRACMCVCVRAQLMSVYTEYVSQ